MAGTLGERGVLRSAISLLLYAVVGVLAGLAAAAMTTAASAYAGLLSGLTAGELVGDIGFIGHATPALAAAAGLSSLAALSMTYLAPEARGASIDELLDEYHHRGAEASVRGVAVKLVATPIAVGGGAPVGILGPVVYVGSSVGGLLGGLLGTGFGLRRRLFIAGIAGAVSWALRAPLGAVFFALEIPYHRDLEAGADAAVASAVGSFSSFLLLVAFVGPPPPVSLAPPAHSAGYVAGVVMVGVLSGLVGRAFSRIYHLGMSVRRVSPITPMLVVPIITVASVMASPLLAGGGSAAVSLALAGSALPAAAALLIMSLRLGVSPLLSGMGVPGGLFGPGLAIGSLLGMCVHSLTGLGDPVGMAVVGMASFYGAVSTTPIGMSIIAAEVSGDYFLVVPSLIASLLAREVMGRDYLYINQKDRRLREGIALARDVAEALRRLGRMGVRAECSGPPAPVIEVAVLDPYAVDEALGEVPAVVIIGDSVAGVVTEESLARYLIGEGEIVESVPVAGCGDDLLDVVDLMVRHNSAYAVLVGDGYRVIKVDEVLRTLDNALKRGVQP